MQTLVGLGVMQGFVGFGNHHIAFALGNQSRDFGIFVVGADLRFGQIRQHIGFVGATWVFNHAHIGLIQAGGGFVFARLGFAHQSHFAKRRIARQHLRLADARDIARDAAHGHIKFVGLQIGHQIRPSGGHISHFHAHFFRHRFNHINVVAAVRAIRLYRKRAIVPRRAHAQGFAL